MELKALEKELCGEDFSNIEEFINSYKEKYPPTTCGKHFGENDISITCKTCSLVSNSSLCLECFLNSNHEGHDYKVSTDINGVCDCGDQTSVVKEGFCPHHKAPDAHPEMALSEEERAKFLSVFDRAGQLLVKLSKESEPNSVPKPAEDVHEDIMNEEEQNHEIMNEEEEILGEDFEEEIWEEEEVFEFGDEDMYIDEGNAERILYYIQRMNEGKKEESEGIKYTENASFIDVVNWLSLFLECGAPLLRCLIMSVMKYIDIDFHMSLSKKNVASLVDFEESVINDGYLLDVVWPKYMKDMPKLIDRTIDVAGKDANPIFNLVYYILALYTFQILYKEGTLVETIRNIFNSVANFASKVRNYYKYSLSGIFRGIMEFFSSIEHIGSDVAFDPDPETCTQIADIFADFILSFEDQIYIEREFGDKQDTSGEQCATMFCSFEDTFIKTGNNLAKFASTYPIKVLLKHLKEKDVKALCPAVKGNKATFFLPLHNYVSAIIRQQKIDILFKAVGEMDMDIKEAGRLLMTLPLTMVSMYIYTHKGYYVRNSDEEIFVIKHEQIPNDGVRQAFNLIQFAAGVSDTETFINMVKTCFSEDFEDLTSQIFVLVANLIFDRTSAAEDMVFFKQIIYLLTKYTTLTINDLTPNFREYADNDIYSVIRSLVTLKNEKFARMQDESDCSCFTSINKFDAQSQFIDNFSKRNKTAILPMKYVEDVKGMHLFSYLSSDFFHELIEKVIRKEDTLNMRMAFSILIFEQTYHKDEYNLEKFLRNVPEEKDAKSLFDVILGFGILGETVLRRINIGEVKQKEDHINQKKLLAKRAREAALENIRKQSSSFIDANSDDSDDDENEKVCPICQEKMSKVIGYPFIISYGPILFKDDKPKLRFLSCMHEAHAKCMLEMGAKICSLDRLPFNAIVPMIPDEEYTDEDDKEKLSTMISKLLDKYSATDLVIGFFNEIFTFELRNRGNQVCITKLKVEVVRTIHKLITYLYKNELIDMDEVKKGLSPIFVPFLPVIFEGKSCDEVFKENIDSQENRLLFCRYVVLVKHILGESVWIKRDSFDEFDINEAISPERIEELFSVDLKGHTVEPYKIPRKLPDNALLFAKELNFKLKQHSSLELTYPSSKGAVPYVILRPDLFALIVIKHNKTVSYPTQIYVNKFGDADPGYSNGYPLSLSQEKLDKLVDDFLNADYLYNEVNY